MRADDLSGIVFLIAGAALLFLVSLFASAALFWLVSA